jgi:hypothetical protein
LKRLQGESRDSDRPSLGGDRRYERIPLIEARRGLVKRGLVAAAVVTGLCLAGAGPAWAVFPGQNGRLIYATVEGATYDTHTILPSGHGDRVIAHAGGPFSWSPNGRRITFSGPGADIFTMRADGSHVRRLTFDGDNYGPNYSPGGGRIVFVHVKQAGGSLTTIMRSDGSDRHVIGDQGGARWTPKGKLVFVKGRLGSTPPSIWKMNPDGSHQRRLVFLGDNGGSGAMYSPDGDEFLFVRYIGDDDYRVLLANADGSDIRQPPCRTAFSGGLPLLPLTYSPDGKWVLAQRAVARGVTTTNIVRVSLGSCTGKRVLSRIGFSGFDWQALP